MERLRLDILERNITNKSYFCLDALGSSLYRHRDPHCSTMSTYLNIPRALRDYGLKETARIFWQMRSVKHGTLVGVDRIGNKYYENREEYPFGKACSFI